MRAVHCVCAALFTLLLASCALRDATARPPRPSLAIPPPPTLVFSGDCKVSSELSDWLEYSTFYVGKFTELISAAATKQAYDVYDDVLLMDRLRSDYSTVVIPDCAEPVERLIMAAMSGAIDGLQAFANGMTDSSSNVVADTLSQFDLATAGLQGLSAQLESQLREAPPDQ